MTGPNCRKYLCCRDGACRFCLHSIIDAKHLIAKPFLNRCIAFLKRAQSGPHDLASRRIRAGSDKLVYITSLFRWKAEGSLIG